MKRVIKSVTTAVLMGVCFFIGLSGAPSQAQTAVTPLVVYHFDDGQAQGLKGLRSIRNQLDTVPATKLAIVALADGVDMFMEGATDAASNIAYAPLIADLKSRGVDVYVCELTLMGRNLSPDQFILEADFTRSGVVKLTELQQVDGYAYIKP
jgi:intracellular sulfur oxidation DsrE/DsrF family protein